MRLFDILLEYADDDLTFKFWINIYTGRIVNIYNMEHHITYVKKAPELFNLSPEEIDAYATGKPNKVWDIGLAEHLFDRGWVRGIWDNHKQILSLHSNNIIRVRRAAKLLSKKIGYQSLVVDIGLDLFNPSETFNFEGFDCDYFLRTGRVPKSATLRSVVYENKYRKHRRKNMKTMRDILKITEALSPDITHKRNKPKKSHVMYPGKFVLNQIHNLLDEMEIKGQQFRKEDEHKVQAVIDRLRGLIDDRNSEH